jgi:hypothetical protein
MSCKQRCVHYTDGTPSREVEEDRETTGQEEMNELYQEIKDKEIPKERKRTILDVRDRLNNLKDIIEICTQCLLYSKLNNINVHVAHVLYFQVQEQIKIAQEELRHV